MIQKDVSLKNYSTFKIGGNASYFLEVKSKEDLIAGLKEWKELSSKFLELEKRIFTFGQGSNLLISDGGFLGLAIYNNIKFLQIKGNVVSCGAGVLVSDLIDFCIENSMSGLEWAGGLPGSVGGAVRGNAGAFGGEIKDNIFRVESLDIETLEIKNRENKECKLVYRGSIFKEKENEIILSADFSLKKGNKDEIRSETFVKINYRKTNHPLHLPSVGSIFKNIPVSSFSQDALKELEGHIKDDPFPVIPVAVLLSMAGVKGKRIGGAEISQDRPNFILNFDGATSKDVRDLIEFEKKVIKEKFGIDLEVEVTFVE